MKKNKIKGALILAITLLFLAQTKAQQVFIRPATTPVVQPNTTSVNIATDDFVFGSPTLNAGIINQQSRFFFDKDQSAFRAGFAIVGPWDTPQIGKFSTAFGLNTIASDSSSFAAGSNTISSGWSSAAFGTLTRASGDHSFTTGFTNEARSNFSSANGLWNIADYPAQFIVGRANDLSYIYAPGNAPLFVVGNGNGPTNRDNALMVLQNGDVVIPDLPQDPADDDGSQPVFVDSDGRLRVLDPSAINPFHQSLSFDPATLGLTISNGNTVTLVDTDDQTLSFNNATNVLTISEGNSVTLPSIGSGGNHLTAGAGINLSSNSINVDVLNGLRIESTDNTVRLGGGLIENTDVRKNNYTMSFSGNGDFVVGSTTSENITGTYSGNKRMFFSDNGAFRAGEATTDVWDKSAGNVARWSVAMGFNTLSNSTASIALGYESKATAQYTTALGFRSSASGNNAIAMGNRSDASGTNTFAAGFSSISSGISSVALGHENKANGSYSIAFGFRNEASDRHTTSMGFNNKASNFGSTAIGGNNLSTGHNSITIGSSNEATASNSLSLGLNNDANGINSIAAGRQSISTGLGSVAFGFRTNSLGNYSFSMGNNTISQSLSEFVVGLNNTVYTPLSTAAWRGTDRIFVVGRGASPNSRQDALVIQKDGTAMLAGNVLISSDRRLKKDIAKIKNANDQLDLINGYTYHWKEEANRSNKLQYGIIAQEIKEVFPSLVAEDGEGHYTVNYDGLIPVLLEAFKEEKAKNNQEIAALKAEMAKFSAFITSKENTKNKSDQSISTDKSSFENRFSELL